MIDENTSLVKRLKGTAICNIPIETAHITNTLRQGSDSNGLLLVKLKRKLKFRGHVYFETVSPDSVYAGLCYLNKNNFLYHGINSNMMCLPTLLKNLAEDKNTTTEDSIYSKKKMRTPCISMSVIHTEAVVWRCSVEKMFCRKGVLRNFAKFTGKHLC